MELYNATLLPNLKSEDIRREVDALTQRRYEIDHGDEIEQIERKAKDKLTAMKTQPKGPVKRTWTPKKKRKHRSL